MVRAFYHLVAKFPKTFLVFLELLCANPLALTVDFFLVEFDKAVVLGVDGYLDVNLIDFLHTLALFLLGEPA